MTKAATIKAIKALGRHMTAKYIPDFNEYRVSFGIPAIQLVNDCSYNEAKERNEALAFYTSDASDAIDTAKAMHARFVLEGKI